MPTARIIETIDVLEDGGFNLPACLPGAPPYQLCLDGFEEGEEDQKTVQWTVFLTQNGGVIVAISLAAHGRAEAMFAQDLLVIVRTVLVASVAVEDAAPGQCP